MTMLVTSNGRVTIPKSIREALGLHPGDRIEIELDGTGGARLNKVTGLTLEEAFTFLAHRKLPYVSDEDMERAAEEGWIQGYRGSSDPKAPIALSPQCGQNPHRNCK